MVTAEEEITRLRRRIKNQRRELRRLNKEATMYWHGWHKGARGAWEAAMANRPEPQSIWRRIFG